LRLDGLDVSQKDVLHLSAAVKGKFDHPCVEAEAPAGDLHHGHAPNADKLLGDMPTARSRRRWHDFNALTSLKTRTRPMRTQPQTSADMQELAKKLEGERTGLLTLADERGALCCRPMTAQELDGEGAVWMMVSHKAPWVANADNAQANLAFAVPDESDYVSISGRVEFVDSPERKRALWTVVARPWWDGPEDPDLLLLKLTPSRIEVWDGPSGAISRTFALAASVIAGKEVGLGEKQVITLKPD